MAAAEPLHKLTVLLADRSMNALQEAAAATGDTQTDTLNRALQLYAQQVQHVQSGGRVLLAAPTQPMAKEAPPAALHPEELLSIEQAHVGDYLGHGWSQEYVEMDGDDPAYYKVVATNGAVVATMPDWAGGIALFLAEAHDAVPRLIAEIRGLSATLAAVAAKVDQFPLLDDESKARDYDLGRHDLAESIRNIISQHASRREPGSREAAARMQDWVIASGVFDDTED